MNDSKDAEERVELFLERYEALVKELEVDFANYPIYIPDGGGGFRTVLQSKPIDIKALPQQSNFVPEE
jgi:hypothetical protein